MCNPLGREIGEEKQGDESTLNPDLLGSKVMVRHSVPGQREGLADERPLKTPLCSPQRGTQGIMGNVVLKGLPARQ